MIKVCVACRQEFECAQRTGRPRTHCAPKCRSKWAWFQRNKRQRLMYAELRQLGVVPQITRWAVKNVARFARVKAAYSAVSGAR